jgi:glycosyltransferase involved in cell wall biosynthesis
LKASVIIPARDAAATIGRTLAGLERQDLPTGEFEVVVVDDGSSDDTAEIADSFDGVRVIRQGSIGAAEARNRGALETTAPVLAFLDADCFPTPGWLKEGLRATERAQLVQGSVRPVPEIPVGPYDRTLWVLVDVGLWQTANLFVTREVFDRIGGFEDWLPVQAGKLIAEDVWFGWRACRAGARSAFARDALVHHEVFARGPGGFIGERRRLVYFPAIARQMPELRQTMFFARVFLSRRTAAFDAGVASVVLALLTRSPVPLAGCVPYGRLAWRQARTHGRRRGLEALVVGATADAVGLVAMLRGMVRYRSPLL